MTDVVNPLVQALLNRMDFLEHNLLQQSRHDIEALATRSQQDIADVRAQLSTVQRSQAPPARPLASHRGPGSMPTFPLIHEANALEASAMEARAREETTQSDMPVIVDTAHASPSPGTRGAFSNTLVKSRTQSPEQIAELPSPSPPPAEALAQSEMQSTEDVVRESVTANVAEEAHTSRVRRAPSPASGVRGGEGLVETQGVRRA